MTPSNTPTAAAPAKVGSTIVLKSLSILLGLFFIFIGAMKLTPHLSKELHRDLVNIFMFTIFCKCVVSHPNIYHFSIYL